MFFIICLWICLSDFVFVNGVNSFDAVSGGMKIALRRQKTPYEQHLNAPDLSKYGINFDWLYKKHHGKDPAPPRTNDSMALKRYLDNEFYGEIVVGHPGQILNVAFDTSWTLSWLMSSQCHTWYYIGCLFHNKYDHDKSSEYKPDNRPITIPEGKYNLTGFFSYDNFSIAHSNVTDFSFAEMTEVPKSFLFSKVDGVLGLGLQYDTYEPFFYAMVRQGKIKNKIFSVYLNRDKQSNKGGNILLGYVEKRHIHSTRDKNNKTVYDPIKFMPVKSGYFWEFDMDSVWVDMQKKTDNLKFCGNGKCSAMTDTSANNIMGPRADIEKIHTAIKARPFFMDRYTVNCDTINKLPTIGFTIGGQNFTLKGRDYTIKMSYLSVSMCLSAFVPADVEDLWVLGGAFLSEYYTIYYLDQKQVGIVKSA